MERGFEKVEIVKALEICDADKNLGPCGFNFFFMKPGWRFLKEDFCKML